MSYATFAASVSGLTVTGVNRKYNQPPERVNSGDMPSMYVRLPQGERSVASMSSDTGLRQMEIEVVIVVEPVGQNTNSANFAAGLALLDNLETALSTEAAANHVLDSWAMRIDSGFIGDVAYWLLIATVNGSE